MMSPKLSLTMIWQSFVICLLFGTSSIQALPHTTKNIASRAVVASSPELRILPLGDSITYGKLSTDGNGYRKQLVANLNQTGNHVLAVGSHKNGTMWDGWNSGFPGYTISQIQERAALSVRYHSNIVLVHAGTNDLTGNPLNQSYHGAIFRLGSLVDYLHQNNGNNSLIMVAQIIGSGRPGVQPLIDEFNKEIPGMVANRTAQGYKIMTVNFQSITAKYLQDGVHPTDYGYQLMGNIWSQAIAKAKQAGLITPPTTPDPALDLSPSPA